MAVKIPQMDTQPSEVFTFICLVLGISWLRFAPPLLENHTNIEVSGSILSILVLLGAISPLIGALILVGYRGGTAECAEFLRRGLNWRVGLVWYLVVFFLFPVLFGAALLGFILQGGLIPPISDEVSLNVITIFTVGIIFNISENYGWRGYLQEALQWSHSALFASVSVGIVWGLWHAPLFLPSEGALSDIPYGWYLVLILGVSVLFGWVYNETDGSVLLVTLMHCAFNAIVGTIVLALILGDADITRYIALCTIVTWLAAGVVLRRNGSSSLIGISTFRP